MGDANANARCKRAFTLYYFVCRIVDVRYTVMLYTVFSFAVIGLEEVFAVYASTEVELGTYLLRNGQYTLTDRSSRDWDVMNSVLGPVDNCDF